MPDPIVTEFGHDRSGTTLDRPANAPVGAIFYNTTTGALQVVASLSSGISQWQEAADIGTGGITINAAPRAFELSSFVADGTETDGAVMRVGSGIGASGSVFSTAGTRAFALYLQCTATTGTFTGMRLRSILNPASGSATSANNLHCQASVMDSKDAAVVNCGFFEVVLKGTNDVDWVRCLLTNLDSPATSTYSAGLINTHLRTHTAGAETMGGVDEQLRIENEAVGTTGRQMDSFIRCMATSMSGGIKGADYLIDGGVATSLLGTAVLRLPADSVTAWDTASDSGDTEAGAIKVVIGTATRYIQLYSDVPVD